MELFHASFNREQDVLIGNNFHSVPLFHGIVKAVLLDNP